MAKSTAYADDTSFITSSTSALELHQLTSKTVVEAAEWFKANRLILNMEKTQKLFLTLRKEGSEEKAVKLLGVHLDAKLIRRTYLSKTIQQWRLMP
ncbi:hypothetical protein ANN_08829 [Periplaneta americana]|uniref:Reverse transcriptase domain-containing protein n=1 Tax=Periplaneta americana TaxID=6978 RepID=A0ABQ8T2H9_PERAM|nr:hypothetical protein ANN_08829 [Periplaneta americana]